MDANHRLATQLAARVAQTVSPTSSLIEGFFMRGGAGILGGAPKCWKSFFASEIATAVATGTPVAGHFTVTRPAPVLVLNAEGVRKQDLVRVLAALEADGYILRVGRAGCAAVPVPAPRSGNAGTHPPRSTHRSCRQVQTLLAPLPPLPSTQ